MIFWYKIHRSNYRTGRIKFGFRGDNFKRLLSFYIPAAPVKFYRGLRWGHPYREDEDYHSYLETPEKDGRRVEFESSVFYFNWTNLPKVKRWIDAVKAYISSLYYSSISRLKGRRTISVTETVKPDDKFVRKPTRRIRKTNKKRGSLFEHRCSRRVLVLKELPIQLGGS